MGPPRTGEAARQSRKKLKGGGTEVEQKQNKRKSKERKDGERERAQRAREQVEGKAHGG
jgi:hypothetical protein